MITDSSYVADAVDGGLEQWEANHWRGKDGRPLKNLDLLHELAEELHRCQVSAVRVSGHSGHLANERVDRAANHAAQWLLGRLLRDPCLRCRPSRPAEDLCRQISTPA
ncbi:MAG: ribonuclease H [Planctomycetaceae bacterium]|nr:ribonuclease H [Planctomycetaceae bacterium]